MKSLRSTLLLALLALIVLAFAAARYGKKEAETPPSSGQGEQLPATTPRTVEQAPPPASGVEEEQQEPAVASRPEQQPPPRVQTQHEVPAPVVVSGPLKRSDVLFSPRVYRADWREALASFRANRIVWTYAGAALAPEAASDGIAVQCTIPFWVPKDDPAKDEMACIDARGEPLGFESGLVYPDINDKAWQGYVLGEAEKLVDAGCTSFQQDMAWLNYSSAVSKRGCYSSDSLTAFRSYAQDDSAMGAQPRPEDFAQPGADALQASFVSFQKASTAGYTKWLHNSIEAYARTRTPPADVTFSGNFATSWLLDGKSDWLLPDFDFFLSEVLGTRATVPNTLRAVAHKADAMRQVSGVTFPTSDVALNQRAIASAYALGLTAIVPWDIFVPDEPRFFGNPADFAPLLDMVRTSLELFDRYVAGTDYFGEYGPVVPGQGTVTAVDRSRYPGRAMVTWSRGSSFKEVALGREVVVGGVKYKTIVQSRVGFVFLPEDADVSVGDPLYFLGSADDYLVSVRKRVDDPSKQAVHAVSWVEKPVSLFLHLRRSDFPVAPTMLVTPERTKPVSITPEVAGDYYVYFVGAPMWAILF